MEERRGVYVSSVLYVQYIKMPSRGRWRTVHTVPRAFRHCVEHGRGRIACGVSGHGVVDAAMLVRRSLEDDELIWVLPWKSAQCSLPSSPPEGGSYRMLKDLRLETPAANGPC